jgi:hypothetical protein
MTPTINHAIKKGIDVTLETCPPTAGLVDAESPSLPRRERLPGNANANFDIAGSSNPAIQSNMQSRADKESLVQRYDENMIERPGVTISHARSL